MGRLVDGAVGLVHAAADAVDLGIGFGQLDEGLVAVADGADGGAHVVLAAAVLGGEAVLGAVQAASDLDVALLGVGHKVGRLDETGREDTGVSSAGHVGLGAEGDGAVLVGGNVTTVDYGRGTSGTEGEL